MCAAPRAEFYRHIDAANVDLKAFTEDFYRKVCVGRLHDVLDTLLYLRHETDVWLEITTLLIPGRNDSDAEIAAECAWIREHLGVDVPVHFTAFHPDYKMLDTPPTPPATLTCARRIGLREGLRFVYTGNVHDAEGGSTRCPGCGSAESGPGHQRREARRSALPARDRTGDKAHVGWQEVTRCWRERCS
jgi:pyruvate formate lyase activating enzyme